MFEVALCCFHPILVIWCMVVFGDEVPKILRNSLFIFHFALPILPCKRKTWHRESRSDEKPKTMLPKYVMSINLRISQQLLIVILWFSNLANLGI